MIKYLIERPLDHIELGLKIVSIAVVSDRKVALLHHHGYGNEGSS